MSRELFAGCVVVGDEILHGYVTDQNASTLATCLRKQGVRLDHVSVVPDRVAEVADAVRAQLQRSRPRLVVTSGGIGPTLDDVTYEGIAAALGLPLTVSPDLEEPVLAAVRWFEDRHGYHVDADARAAWMRIARVPEGAHVLTYRRWLAAVAVEVRGGIQGGGATIVALPGPPGHFESLLRHVVIPRFVAGRGADISVTEIAHDYPETLLAGCLGRIRQTSPEVAVGSYPGSTMLVRIEGPEAQVAAAANIVRQELARLDAHPSAADMRRTWEQQPVSWDRGRPRVAV